LWLMRRPDSPFTILLVLAIFLCAFHGVRLPPVLHAAELSADHGPMQPGYVVPNAWPQSSYEEYEPPARPVFDLRKFWMRADLRVRPEWRNGVCFGGGAPRNGACNSLAPDGSGTGAFPGRSASDFFVQQWARLGIGYDLSPDVNFYFEIEDSATWGGNGNPLNGGDGGDPLNHNCGSSQPGQCRLGIRAGYVLVRNVAGIQGFSIKAGRQYLVMGNQRLFGHFDWANTGYSHDGVMLSYATSSFDTKLGWFRHSDTDLAQAAPYGSVGPNIPTPLPGYDGNADVDMVVLYNQIRSVPSMVIEPYYVLYHNRLSELANPGQYNAKFSSQVRHMIGARAELRRGNWDFVHEIAYQFGRAADGAGADNRDNLRINAWASGTWLGYTWYDNRWKPRVAAGFDYASGDGDANCVTPGGVVSRSCGGNANTFENFFPTNFLHVGYMLNGAWRNSVQPHVNFQARPTARDHIEIWALRKYLASARDNWYRGSQGPLIFSRADNTANHVGDEIDVSWSHFFADGKVSLAVIYGHFFSGSYIRNQLGTSADQDWGIVQLWTNF
ncbi:MAG: alginate export family protein, partial [Nitrospiraceae bacterium]